MRLRHKAAENALGYLIHVLSEQGASMRLRHKAAENWKVSVPARPAVSCFNEAAA